MPTNIRVIQYGLGPIGNAMARYIVRKPGLDLVGAVDVDPAKLGIDVGEAIGLEGKLGCLVTGNLAPRTTGADVVARATSSHFSVFRERNDRRTVGCGLHHQAGRTLRVRWSP